MVTGATDGSGSLASSVADSIGSLADTGASVLAIIGLAITLLAVGVVLYLLRTKRFSVLSIRESIRHKLRQLRRRQPSQSVDSNLRLSKRLYLPNISLPKTLSILVLSLAAIGIGFGLYAASTTQAAPTLTIDSSDEPLTITIPQGGGEDSATTTITTSTLNPTGYQLTTQLTDSEPGIDIAIQGGEVTTVTPLSPSDSPLTLLTTNSANTPGAPDQTPVTLTFTVDASVTPGLKQLKLVYKATDNFVPIDQTVCENANPASGCKVSIDAGMIPVTYTGDSVTVEWSKADTASMGDWYDYQNQKWANAVTVSPGALASYQSAPAGTPISDSDILGFWAYVPRFAYEVQRRDATDAPLATQTMFDIKFETKQMGKNFPAATCSTGVAADGIADNHKDYRTECGIDREYSTASLGTVDSTTTWATHPAFTLDPDGYPTNNNGNELELDGIWVAKFEAGQDVSCIDNSHADCGTTLTSVTPQFKPYKAPQHNKTIGTQFAIGLNVQSSHGLTTDAKTRMMRSDDWGAVSYLSTSRYGIYNSDGTARQAKVYNNGYVDFTAMVADSNTDYFLQTGCGPITDQSDGSGAVCTEYQSAIGTQASATGNVYGVYDLAGGGAEYVAANYNSTTNSSYFDSIDFANYPEFINIYPEPPFLTNGYFANNDICTFETCGGQGLHEARAVQSVSSNTQSWGSDYSGFVRTSSPWFSRGVYSDYESYAGLWASLNYSGGAYAGFGWRAVQSN